MTTNTLEIARNMVESPDNWPPMRVKQVAEALIAAAGEGYVSEPHEPTETDLKMACLSICNGNVPAAEKAFTWLTGKPAVSADLDNALIQIKEYLAERVDTVDGPDSQPRANEAANLHTLLCSALGEHP